MSKRIKTIRNQIEKEWTEKWWNFMCSKFTVYDPSEFHSLLKKYKFY